MTGSDRSAPTHQPQSNHIHCQHTKGGKDKDRTENVENKARTGGHVAKTQIGSVTDPVRKASGGRVVEDKTQLGGATNSVSKAGGVTDTARKEDGENKAQPGGHVVKTQRGGVSSSVSKKGGITNTARKTPGYTEDVDNKARTGGLETKTQLGSVTNPARKATGVRGVEDKTQSGGN